MQVDQQIIGVYNLMEVFQEVLQMHQGNQHLELMEFQAAAVDGLILAEQEE
jgi:hypothetical protein